MQLLPGDLSYFSTSYEDSRRRFLQATQGLPPDAQRGQWQIPSDTETNLTVEHVFLPATQTPQNLLVMISGVHGLEGYAGSAIQSMFLQEFLPRLDRTHLGVLIVHALNPYGFKHHRRNTENHVNLNRNCSTRADLYRFKNAESLKLSERFIPRAKVSSLTSHLVQQRNERQGHIHFDDVSMDAFIKTVGVGQYEKPEGLEYGGQKPEPQIQALIDHLRRIMPAYKDILLLDLHTGLGDRGRLHLLTGDVEGSVHSDLFARLFQPADDKSIYAFTSADSEGFYKTLGATNNIFPELATAQQRVCALTMEFGTLGHDLPSQVESLNQWLLEHQGTFYGYQSSELDEKIRRNYLEKFFPADPDWRMQILSVSRMFFERVFARLQKLG